MTQLSVTENPPIGIEGEIATARRLAHIISCIVGLVAGLKPGRLVMRGTREQEVILPTPGVAVDVAASANAFILATATSASIQSFTTAAQVAGTLGLSTFSPARRAEFVLSNHADFDAVTAVFTYLNELGIQVSENIVFPNGGNTTLYSTGLVTKFVSLVIPAQSGTGGSMTVGVAKSKATTALTMAAVVDSFIVSTASPSADTTYSTQGQVAGLFGLDEIPIARKLTLVLSSHANWDATTAVLTYINELGQQVTENLAIPDAGNTTLYSTGYCARFISLFIPAQSGTAGTFTVGTAAGGQDSPTTGARLNLRQAKGFTVYEDMKTGAPPDYAYANRATHAQYDLVPVMSNGTMFVKPEDVVADGQGVWVRVVANGGNDQLGAVRGTPDGTTCVYAPFLRFASSGDAGSIAKLHCGLAV